MSFLTHCVKGYRGIFTKFDFSKTNSKIQCEISIFYQKNSKFFRISELCNKYLFRKSFLIFLKNVSDGACLSHNDGLEVCGRCFWELLQLIYRLRWSC